MYKEYWNLSGNPFENRFSKDLFFASEGHAEGLARLRFFANSTGQIANLAGKPGTGKSYIAYLTKQTLDELGTRVTLISCSDPSPVEILQIVLSDWGVEHSSSSRVELRRSIESFIRQNFDSEKDFALIILDCAELISNRQTFDELRALVEMTHNDRKPLKLILVTERAISPRNLDYGTLAARVDFRYTVPTLTLVETHSYVNHRLSLVKGRRDIFSPDALDEVYRHTMGVPRKINVLCDLCMLIGCAEGVQQIDLSLVRQAGDELSA